MIQRFAKLKEALPNVFGLSAITMGNSLIILFCFSGTGTFGAMNSAVTGDHSILYAKAIMDFLPPSYLARRLGIWWDS